LRFPTYLPRLRLTSSENSVFNGRGIVFSTPPSERDLLMVAHSIVHLRIELGCSLPVEVFVGSWGHQLYPGWAIPGGAEWEFQREAFKLPGVRLRVVETRLEDYLEEDNRFMWKVMVGSSPPF
jgi:hypothetical protein